MGRWALADGRRFDNDCRVPAATILDRSAPPSRAALLSAIGPARRHWIRLEEFVRAQYGLEGETIQSGGDAWSMRFRRSGKALFTLIPRGGGFTALVVVGPSAWDAAAQLDLTAQTKAAWEAAHPYHDGRWLWLDVVNENVAADVERLVRLKSPPPTRRRPAVSA